MSVQAGIWKFDGGQVEPSYLANVSHDLALVGPDGESEYLEPSVAILHRPFYITAESRLERQPYRSPGGNVITWNGRLDNRDELALELTASPNTILTDLDLIAAAFDRWGSECFSKFIGDWALSVWIPSRQELLLAVDYVSFRRLYYRVTDKEVTWCSRLAPMVLRSETTLSLDDDYIAGYLALYGVPGHTPYSEIRAVEPGHYVRVQPRRAFSHQYWTFSPNARIRYKTDEQYEDHFRQLFRISVGRRLRSESPVLAELSGGLDSSSIVCMADDILSREGASTPRVDTISFFDLREPNGDDLCYLKKIEQKRGRVGHHFDVCNYENSLLSARSSFAAIPGSLIADSQCAQECARMRHKENYRVTLSGIGGDEMLGGVPDPRPQLADLLLTLRFFEFAKQTTHWSLIKRKPWLHIALRALSEFAPHSFRARFSMQSKVPDWVDGKFAKYHDLSMLQLGPQPKTGYCLPSRKDSARTVLLLIQQMACSAEDNSDPHERRYPYLDRNLVEFLLSIPADQLLRPGERRSLMRRALAGLVPEEVLQRRTKAVTARRPLNAIENDWNQLAPILSSSLAAQFGYVNQGSFYDAFLAAKSGKAPQLVRLLRALSLELWLRDVVDRKLIDPPYFTQFTSVQTFSKSDAAPGTMAG